MARILLIEDDPDLSEGLTDAFQMEGYQLDHAGSGPLGLEQARRRQHDLIILDVMLPGLSGFDLLKEIREAGVLTPVLMLTARGEEMDKVRGLKSGADDYLTKPFGMMELVARVEALLRRSGASRKVPGVVEKGRIRVDFRSRKAWRRKREIQLTGREFQILEYLASHAGEAVRREDLVRHIWGTDDDVEVSTRTVDQHIASLRRKLEEDPSSPDFIETVYGYGYRLRL